MDGLNAVEGRQHAGARLFVMLLLGAVAALIAIQLPNYDKKFLAGALGAASLSTVVMCLGDRSRIVSFLVFALTASIPFHIDFHFLARPHIGGAVGINVSVTSVLALVLIWLMLRQHRLRYSPALFIPPLLYMLAGAMSLLNAAYPAFVLFELFRLSLLVALLVLVMNLERSQLQVVVMTLLACVIIEGVISVIQYKTGKNLGLEFFGESALVKQNIGFIASRTTGTIGHPNYLAYYYELLIPLAFAMLLVERRMRLRVLYGISLICGMVGMLTTLSRGAWLSVPVSLIAVFLYVNFGVLFKLRTAITIFLCGLLFLVAGYFMYPTIEKRLFHDDYRSAWMRKPLNLAALSIIKQYPVFGVGLNNCGEVFKKYDTTGKSRVFAIGGHVVHNMFLLEAVDVGLVGFSAFMAIFISAFIVVGRLMLRVDRWYRGLLAGVGAGLLAHLIHGLADAGFLPAMNISSLVFLLLGIIGAVAVLHRRQSAAGA